MSEQDQPNWYLPGSKGEAFDIQGEGKNAPAANDARQIPMRGLSAGGNTASVGGNHAGWVGTVHDLTSAEKARNFRASLDRQRAAAHPQIGASGGAIADQGREKLFTIPGPERSEKIDRGGEYEKRIAELEGKVEQLLYALAEAQSPFQSVFLAAQDGSNTAQWKEYTANGSNVAIFQDGRSCLSGTAAGQILAPGTNSVFGMLEVWNGSARAYFRLAGSVDLDLDGVVVVTQTPFININNTLGTDNVFKFAADTDTGGKAGGQFTFLTPPEDGVVVIAWSGKFMIDHVRMV